MLLKRNSKRLKLSVVAAAADKSVSKLLYSTSVLNVTPDHHLNAAADIVGDTVLNRHVISKNGNISPSLPVPEHILKPKYAVTGVGKFYSKIQICKTEEEKEAMRNACKLARKTLNFAKSLVQVGVTTDAIDKAIHEFIISHNAYPSPLNYNKFPKSVCTSVNNIMVHGIPDDRPLESGDIINIDVTVYLNGYHGDCSETLFVGEGHEENVCQLVRVTREALYNAIKICGPGVYINKIGATISNTIEPYGYVSVRGFCGHGVGKHFHGYPIVNHYKSKRIEAGPVQVFKPGMTFTIEPIINMSTNKWKMWNDGWTIVTANGEMSATWEHSLLITDDGVEVLTADDNEDRCYKLSKEENENDSSMNN